MYYQTSCFDSERKNSVVFDSEGEENETELRVDPTKFGQAVIWGTDWTTETIAMQLEKGNIDLNPSFQRRDAWSEAEKSRLIESLMLGLPVPPIILAENKEKRNSYIVIDGKQRLLSIRRFYSKITEKDFKEHNYEESNAFKQLKLKGLDILKDLNTKTFECIQNEYPEYIRNLENQAIRTIVIKNWPDESFLYTVFLRLNTGSKKLSPQELRQALKPGEFLTYLDEATANSAVMRKMLNNKGADPRMKDIELALRYFAFKSFPEIYNGNLKDFLDETCERLNKDWDTKETSIKELFSELESAIEFAQRVISEKSPFSRYTNGLCNDRFNRAIFEILTFYFSIPDIRNAIQNEEQSFKQQFIALNDDKDFVYAVSDTTKDVGRITIRYNKMFDLLIKLEYIKENHITIPRLVNTEGKLSVEVVTA